ncbi:outer membrane beta-barrel protein [Helicobacter suis]|uniref:outer membrane beta-barrel protein n=1 Tax=Helicobacter suis TaxID=104628 RepID=UPI002D7805BC|nr:outer membrane beta-barrel protein [Helicobacter suis]
MRSVFSLVFTRSIALAGALSLISLAPLSAEKNGAFVEGGFQYSNFSGAGKIINGETSYQWAKVSGNLFGADIQIGYKQFFGAKKRFGLRYYGFLAVRVDLLMCMNRQTMGIMLPTTSTNPQPIFFMVQG